MTKEYLMSTLYNINDDVCTVGDELERMLEQLRFRREELKTLKKDLKDDKIISGILRNIEHDLNGSISTLENCLSVYNAHKEIAKENLDLCRRVAKGGIEDYEAK